MRTAFAVVVLTIQLQPVWADGPGGFGGPTGPLPKQKPLLVADVTAIQGKVQITYMDSQSGRLKCSDIEVSLVGPGAHTVFVGKANFPDPVYATPVKAKTIDDAAGRCRYTLTLNSAAFGKSLELSFRGPVGRGYVTQPIGWQNPIAIASGGLITKDVGILVSTIH